MNKDKYLPLDCYDATSNEVCAFMPRTQSSVIVNALVDQYHPERRSGLHTPTPSAHDAFLIAPRVETTEGKNVFTIIRDPIDRFKSTIFFFGWESKIDDVLSDLETNGVEGINRKQNDQPASSDVHFASTVFALRNKLDNGTVVKLYKMDAHWDQLWSDLGLSGSNDAVNNSLSVTLTDEQVSRLEVIYADDVALYNSITEAGFEYTVVTPDTVISDEDREAKLNEIRYARYAEEIGGITYNGLSILTDKTTQNELSKALSLVGIDPSFEIDWEFSDGTIVHLNGEMITDIATVVFTHVQTTRTKFASYKALIDGTTTKEELDNIVW